MLFENVWQSIDSGKGHQDKAQRHRRYGRGTETRQATARPLCDCLGSRSRVAGCYVGGLGNSALTVLAPSSTEGASGPRDAPLPKVMALAAA